MGRAARLVKLYFEKNEVLPKRQCVTTTPPPLWFLLNETFQIEFLALAPRSRHSRPHTVSLPRQSDTGALSTRHDAPGSHNSCSRPIGQVRRLRHVLGQPDHAASLAECDQRRIELIWREVQGIPAPPVPIAPPEPSAYSDVSLAISVTY